MHKTVQACDVGDYFFEYMPQGIRTSSDDSREREEEANLEIVGRFVLQTSTLMC